MALDYGFAGEVSRDNAMNATADTMNQKNMEILSVSSEMGGKKAVELDGNYYLMEKMSASELTAISDKFDATGNLTGNEGVKNDIMTLMGLDSTTVKGGAEGLTVNLKVDAVTKDVTMSLCFTDKNTGRTMSMGVIMDSDAMVLALSPLKEVPPQADGNQQDPTTYAISSSDFKEVNDQGGLLHSWGILDSENLNPGDLFIIQQQLQMMKDLISSVHSTGKTQGDVMREVTQKFAQG